MEWTLFSTDHDRGVEIRLTGDLDLYNAPRFSIYVLQKIEVGWSKILLDMRGVEYLDSTGAGSLIRIAQALRKKGAKLRCRNLGGSPRRVLEMANILPLLEETR